MRVLLLLFFLVAGLFFVSVAPADAICIFGICIGEEPSPPPPPPPPTIQALCDGKKPSNAFQFFSPCTDINNLKDGELVTLEGYNFTPGSKGSSDARVRLPNGVVTGGFNIAEYPAIDGLYIDVDGNGRFTAVTRIDDHYGQTKTTPPGIYTLEVTFTKPSRTETESARVNLNIVARPTPTPVPPPPTLPPTPFPTLVPTLPPTLLPTPSPTLPPQPPSSTPEPPKPAPATPILGLNSTRAKPGDTITITEWPGFSNNVRVNVYFDDTLLKSVFLSSDFPQVVIPTTAKNGQHTVKIAHFDGLGSRLSGPIEIYGAEEQLQKPETNKLEIILDPSSGPAGTAVIVKGTGFHTASALHAKFDSKQLMLDQGVATNEKGSFTTLIKIPLEAQLGKHIVSFSTGTQNAKQVVSGSYRCLEASGLANCRTLPPIVLKTDGTYSISSEKGTYSIQGDKIFLSEAKIRGVGSFNSDYLQILFQYTYNDRAQKIVYLWEDLNSPPKLGQKAFAYAEASFVVIPTPEEPKTEEKKDEPNLDQGQQEQKDGQETKDSDDGASTNTGGMMQGETYENVESKAYGDVETKDFGDIDTKAYGDVQVRPFGGVEIRAYGGDVETNDYGDIDTKAYGEVQAPTYEEPTVNAGDCNPSIPLYSQPGCNQLPLLEEPSSFMAGIFDSFKKFLKSIFGSKPKNTTPVKQTNSEEQPIEQKVNEQEQTRPSSQPAQVPSSGLRLSGSYRCWSYNVSGGGGGNCRLMPPIVLNQNGTYSMSSEQGTYKVEGNTIYLSESKIRGPGQLLEDNTQIRFEYDYNGWHHTITYLKEDIQEKPVVSTPATPKETYVEVTLRIVYPEGDYSADSVNTVTLYTQNGQQVVQSLAYATDRSTTEVWFSKRSPKQGVLTGQVYKVMVSSGFGEWQAGELDLRNVTQDSTITIEALPN